MLRLEGLQVTNSKTLQPVSKRHDWANHETLQICSTMNLTLAFELQGPITAELVERAWDLIKQEFPYFASTIAQDEYGQLWFKRHQGRQDCTYVEWSRHDGEIDWHPKLVQFANTQRDHTKALAHLQLHSSGAINHFLFITINHAGIDGLSTFHVMRVFFQYLGDLAYGYEPQLGQPKENVDIGERVPEIDVTQLRPLQVPHDYLPMLSPLENQPTSNKTAFTDAEFVELSAQETSRLIQKCRENKATVQGAISAASAIAIAQAQKAVKPLPQTLLMQCPANMRQQVNPPCRDDEPSCAASFLWWQQTMTSGDFLWDLAKSCTENIKRESDQYGGLTFWARLHASKTLPEMASCPTPPYSPPYTVTSSSVGINPIQVDNGPIKVLRTHMMLSTFGIVNEKEAGTMTHAHTFGGRLHVTFTYNMPAVGRKRGRAMAATQLAVLQVLASDNPNVRIHDFMVN